MFGNVKNKICLNMIVKNEKKIIERCLKAVIPLIDYWVIVDTGSIDGTQDVIRQCLMNIPGELHEIPFRDFSYNRNKAMGLCKGKGDYLLLLDADDLLFFHEEFFLPELKEDQYFVPNQSANSTVFESDSKCILLKNNDAFEWIGELFELMIYKNGIPSKKDLSNVFNYHVSDGSRAIDPNKLVNDLDFVEKEIRINSNNSRFVYYAAFLNFYLCRYFYSFFYLNKKIEMGGLDNEIGQCFIALGLVQKKLKYSPDVFLSSFSNAYKFACSRLQAAAEMASHWVECDSYFEGYALSRLALALLENPKFSSFNRSVPDWLILLMFFVCSSQLGLMDEARAALDKLLSDPRVTIAIKDKYQLNEWNKFFSKNNNNLAEKAV